MTTANDLLKKIEWAGTATLTGDYQSFTVPRCLFCDGLKNDTKINHLHTVKGGHSKECDLFRFLNGEFCLECGNENPCYCSPSYDE